MFVEISFYQLLWSNVMVVLSLLISLVFTSKFEWKILFAALRTFLQLFIVGYILKFVFASQGWHYALLTLFAMHLAAGFICLSSLNISFKRLDFLFSSFLSISVGMASTFLLTKLLVIDFRPWYRPDYLIPLSGMIIGNSINSITLYHRDISKRLDDKKEFVLSLFVFGVGAKRALYLFCASGYLTGLMPTVNAMLMIGIVKLPGMMTGQIIGGGGVTQSTYYQIVIMFMILFSSALSMLVFRYFHPKLIFKDNAYFRE